jgi:Cu2+-exporting ATPase
MFTLIGIGAGLLFCLVSLDCFFQMFSPEFKTEMGTVHLYFEATTVILTLVLWGNY